MVHDHGPQGTRGTLDDWARVHDDEVRRDRRDGRTGPRRGAAERRWSVAPRTVVVASRHLVAGAALVPVGATLVLGLDVPPGIGALLVVQALVGLTLAATAPSLVRGGRTVRAAVVALAGSLLALAVADLVLLAGLHAGARWGGLPVLAAGLVTTATGIVLLRGADARSWVAQRSVARARLR
ncbi:hypothetical protein [Cellulosimicrobium marinum]|uniref:hypothetical protein n=1 Tax=Cellulosimicrobium marinum TaxID=1638992 RepID=UPI001E5C52D3|nr:hypothetical protein [Cellulosimicrobium marinum]MCB7135159.1 hypothetical protein [Cellulosimicrobium marinum]